MAKKNYPGKGNVEAAQFLSAFELLLSKPALNFRQEKYTDLLNDLQSNILAHHRKTDAIHYFLKFTDRDKALDWLSDISHVMTSARQQLEKATDYNLNIYLTYSGYKFLHIPDAVIPEGKAFRSGLNGRIKLSKDEHQHPFSSGDELHALVIFAYNAPGTDDSWQQIKQAAGLKELLEEEYPEAFTKTYIQHGQKHNPLPEALQFKDGASNLQFFPGAFLSPNGTPHAVSPSDLPSLDLILRHDSGGNFSHSCGSYAAFLKFEIHEDAINQLIKVLCQELDIDTDLAFAHIMGRFLDGTPLTLSDKPNGGSTNSFNYEELIKVKDLEATQGDTLGMRCPFHAHIRKAYGRKAGQEDVRIARRSVYYNNKSRTSKEEKGLLFLSFQTSLEKQFEEILNNWMLNEYAIVNDGDRNQLIKTCRDILFSEAGDVYDFPIHWNQSQDQKKKITIPATMITSRGGAYLFAPSISFFKKIHLYKGLKNRHAEFLSFGKEHTGSMSALTAMPNMAVPNASNEKPMPDEPVMNGLKFVTGTSFKIN